MTGNGLSNTRSVKTTQVFLNLIRLIRPPGGDIFFGKSVGLESYILTRKVSYLTWNGIVGVTKHLNSLPLVGYLTG